MTDVEECLLRGILDQLVELQGNLGDGIASSFLDLTDTPSAYTGQAGKVILVNPGETGLAFATLAGGGDMLQATYDPNNDGKIDIAQTTGFGTIATQDSDDVSITGGIIDAVEIGTGVTFSGPSDTRDALELGTSNDVEFSTAKVGAGGFIIRNGDGYDVVVKADGAAAGITIQLPSTAGTLLLNNGDGSSLTNLNAGNIASGILSSARGGTGNGFTKFSGPASAEKTFTLPNASATILTDNAAVTIAQGGTGQTTANAALNALLPAQTGNSGKVLTTDGSNTSWTTASGGSPGGSDTYVQFNDSGSFGGVSGLTANKTTGALTHTRPALGTTPAAGITLQNTTAATNGAQQWSPLFELSAQAYKSSATAASQTVKSGLWTRPVQGTSAPTAWLDLGQSINGAAYGTTMSVGAAGTPAGSNGAVVVNGALATTSIMLNQHQWIGWGGSNVIKSDGSNVELNNIPFVGAAYIALGPLSATPAARAYRGQQGGGSNITGGDVQLTGGLGTGTGNGGSVITQTSLPGSSGSTTHTNLSTRSFTAAKATALTHATATAFAQVSLQTSKVVGGKLIASVCATDGTDWQCRTVEVVFSAVNKSGTITVVTNQTDGDLATSAIGETLALTFDAVQNGTAIDLRCAATSSLAATYEIKWAIVALNSNDSTTVTPQ